jgi:7-cyano-7-deazaguanine synthase
VAVVLLSGGLDSALNLAIAAKEQKATFALTMLYGQRAEQAEATAAKELCEYYQVPWRVVDIRWLGDVNPTSLTRKDSILPHLEISELDQMDKSTSSMKSVWVANRNGLFLNIAASYAEALKENEILVGFNLEEASTFPDNSADFIDAINRSFSFSTLNQVKVNSYTTSWNKNEILKHALEIELPLEKVWSCYQPGPDRCWKCESCRRTERALLNAGPAGMAWLKKLGKNT